MVSLLGTVARNFADECSIYFVNLKLSCTHVSLGRPLAARLGPERTVHAVMRSAHLREESPFKDASSSAMCGWGVGRIWLRFGQRGRHTLAWARPVRSGPC